MSALALTALVLLAGYVVRLRRERAELALALAQAERALRGGLATIERVEAREQVALHANHQMALGLLSWHLGRAMREGAGPGRCS